MRHFLLLLLVFSCLTSSSIGQSSNIDSLKNELSNHLSTDTLRAKILLDLGFAYRRKSVDTAFIYAKEALVISEKEKFITGIGSSNYLLGRLYYYQGEYKKAIPHNEIALELALQKGIPMRIAVSYMEIAAIYVKMGDREKGKNLYLKGLPYAEKSGHSGIHGEYYNRLATLYEFHGNYDKAIEYYQTALQYIIEAGQTWAEASIYHNLGVLYNSLGNFLTALEFQQKALKVAEENDYQTIKASILITIGKVYIALEEYPNAIRTLKESANIYNQVGNISGLLGVDINLAEAYQNINALDSAKYFYQKALDAAQKMNNKSGIGSSQFGLAELELLEGNPTKAIELATEVLKLRKEIKSDGALAETEILLGRAYLKQGNLEKAELYLSRGLEKANEVDAYIDLNRGYASIYQLYQTQGRYKEALKAHIAYKATSDSLLNERNIREITALEKQYEFDKEKAVIELENQQQQLEKEQQLKEQRYILIGTSAGLFFMFVLAAISYRSFRIKQRANQQLTTMNAQIFEQKEEIQHQSKELQSTNEKLVALDSFKEDLTGMLVHDLKNPLNTIVHSVENYTPENNQKIKQAGHQLHNLVLNILDVYKYENSQMNVEQSEVSLSEFVQKSMEDTSLLVSNKSIALTSIIPSDIQVKADQEVLLRVFANLLTNALKYTPQYGTIQISAAVENEGMVSIRVADSGKGIPPDQLENIFNKFIQLDAKKSGSMRSTGLGLTFCKMAVEAHKGEIRVESEVGKGTTFIFTLPISHFDQQAEQTPSFETPKHEIDICLSPVEKETLEPIIAVLSHTLVFEVGKVKAILKNLDQPTQGIKKWCEEVNKSILILNEEHYKHLLDIASRG